MCYEHVLDYICFNMPTADSPNPYMCETTDYTAYAILICRTNSVHEVETYCIYYSVQLTSLNKKGEAWTQSSRTQSYSGTPRLQFDNFPHSGNWRRVLFSLPKGAGHGHSLVTGGVFRPENLELQY